MQLSDPPTSSESRARFTLRGLLLTTAAVGVACSLYLYARNFYYAERRETQAVLRDVKGIAYEITTFADDVEEVARVNITLDEHPDSHIAISGLGKYRSDRRFGISRIGKWRFVIYGRHYAGAYLEATGEPVESDYLGGHIELGPYSPYNKIIPFKVHTLHDLVEHYQELVDLFETWPREAEPGTLTLEDGSPQYFYVVEDAP